MTTSWHCLHCDAGETGTNWAALDKAAERHAKGLHVTLTKTTGSRRVRDETGARDLRAGGSP